MQRKDYGIEEHLYDMILELFKLECSSIFRQKVDPVVEKCNDYYDFIKNPMDLTTLKVYLKSKGQFQKQHLQNSTGST